MVYPSTIPPLLNLVFYIISRIWRTESCDDSNSIKLLVMTSLATLILDFHEVIILLRLWLWPWLCHEWKPALKAGTSNVDRVGVVIRSLSIDIRHWTVNTNVKLWCSFATKFFAMASFKTMQDLIFLSRTSNFIDDEEFFSVVWPFWVELSVRNYSTFNLNEMTESECLSEFRFRKRDILMW